MGYDIYDLFHEIRNRDLDKVMENFKKNTNDYTKRNLIASFIREFDHDEDFNQVIRDIIVNNDEAEVCIIIKKFNETRFVGELPMGMKLIMETKNEEI